MDNPEIMDTQDPGRKQNKNFKNTKNEQYGPHKNRGNPVAREGWAAPASYMTPFMLLIESSPIGYHTQ